MKIILNSDVQNLGKTGDSVTVKPGYARNFLLPRKFAVLDTPSNRKSFEMEHRKRMKNYQKNLGTAQQLKERAEALVLKFQKQAGEEGKLFGSVTNAEIAESLAVHGIEIDRRLIHLEEPIKTLGDFKVEVKVHSDVMVTLSLTVERAE